MSLKYMANFISLIRIAASISLLFVDLHSWKFVFLYLLCGFSDILDGYIARRTSTQSILGAKLDTIADMIMFAVVLYLFLPIITLSMAIVVWLLVILAIRVVAIGIVYLKYKMFAILHTISNKVTGILLYFIPLVIGTAAESAYIYVVCAMATVSSVGKREMSIYSIKVIELGNSE